MTDRQPAVEPGFGRGTLLRDSAAGPNPFGTDLSDVLAVRFPMGPEPVAAPSVDRSGPEEQEETTVTVRCTGHVRDAVGSYELEFTFTGTRLRKFLDAFFEEYDVEDLLIAETEAEATAHGWAPVPEDLPGSWYKNPEGDQTRPYTRVLVNGRFNELADGFDTELEDGDRVALVYPFMFCC